MGIIAKEQNGSQGRGDYQEENREGEFWLNWPNGILDEVRLRGSDITGGVVGNEEADYISGVIRYRGGESCQTDFQGLIN